jgi:glycosyltransferase involved in cell wall biosynthesis
MVDGFKVTAGKDVHPQPRVSVIMPAYNVSEYIGEALDSVFCQTLDCYEVIVINDGSPDTKALEAVLSQYKDRIVYIIQENQGPSSARNAGIEIARGEYVAFLDSDDAWFPDYLEVQLRELEGPPQLDVVYPNGVVFGNTPETGLELMSLSPSDGPVTVESLISKSCTVLISVLARRNVLIRAGMFDTSLRGCEDFDLWLRVLRSGGTIGYHRRVVMRYRRRKGSLSSDVLWMYDYLSKVLNKFESNFQLSESEELCLIDARKRLHADAALIMGKNAIIRGDARSAIDNLTQANEVLGQGKIRLALAMLRIAPTVAVKALRYRVISWNSET